MEEDQHLRALVERFGDLEPMQIQERKVQLRKIEEDIAAHVTTRDLLVFPALQELQDEQVRNAVCHRMAEHRALHMLLVDIREAYTPLLFDLGMLRLRLNMERHLDDEEKGLYPLGSRLGRRGLNRLSQVLEERERDDQSFLGERAL